MGEKREDGDEGSGHTHHHHPRRKRSIDTANMAKGSQTEDGQPQRSHQMKPMAGRKSSLSSRIKRNTDGEIISYTTLDGTQYTIGGKFAVMLLKMLTGKKHCHVLLRVVQMTVKTSQKCPCAHIWFNSQKQSID